MGFLTVFTNKTGAATGRFLSSFSYVLTTLTIYSVLCLVTYILLLMTLEPQDGPSFIAYEITTGGDPFNFREVAPSHPVLWIWILFMHILSWLIVPVLAATAIDAAYRQWEERQEGLKLEVQTEMCGVLERNTALQTHEANQVAQALWDQLDKTLAIKKRTR